jgi:hypothetical protein
LRSHYAVSYKPAAFRTDGHYRTIKVQAQNQKGLRICSRKGYRSPAEYDAPNMQTMKKNKGMMDDQKK